MKNTPAFRISPIQKKYGYNITRSILPLYQKSQVRKKHLKQEILE